MISFIIPAHNELGNVPFGNNISCLYHVYVRGEAARQAKPAADKAPLMIAANGVISSTSASF
jgi:hypothetical protein